MIDGLDGMVEACHAAQSYEPWQLAAMLAEKNQAMKLVEKGYVPAIGRALAQARYADAKALAQQAVAVVPDGTAAVKATLDGERQKVSTTVGTLRRLCDDIKADARYRTGKTWCFPSAAPPGVQSATDGWGRALLYSPVVPGKTQGCSQGFALTSYGGDGQETQDDRQSPAAEIICQFVNNWDAWQVPNRYWLITEGAG